MIEASLSIVLTAILALTFVPLLVQATQSYATASARSRSIHDAKLAVTRMTRELTLLGSVDILGIQAQQFSFRDAQGTLTNYAYAAGNQTLSRAGQLVLPNVTALTFTYYDGNRNMTNTIANVRRIDVQLTTSTVTSGAVTFRTEVYPRSMTYVNFQ